MKSEFKTFRSIGAQYQGRGKMTSGGEGRGGGRGERRGGSKYCWQRRYPEYKARWNSRGLRDFDEWSTIVKLPFARAAVPKRSTIFALFLPRRNTRECSFGSRAWENERRRSLDLIFSRLRIFTTTLFLSFRLWSNNLSYSYWIGFPVFRFSLALIRLLCYIFTASQRTSRSVLCACRFCNWLDFDVDYYSR